MAHNAEHLLTDQEVIQYWQDGFIVPRYRIAGPELAELQALMNRLVSDNPSLIDVPMSSPHIPGTGTQGLKSTAEWLSIATKPEIIDMVEQLVGEDIILWGSSVFYKQPKAGKETPWHRDGFPYPIFPLETTSVWIAATDSTVANGCLRIIRGSHAARHMGEHAKSTRQNLVFQHALPDADIDESKAVDIELKAGQMVIFDVYTIHGARANRGHERAGYSLRFMPSTSHYDHDSAKFSDEPGFSHNTRPLILVRGRDRTGRNDFRRGHPQLGT